jgi:L-arabinose isomerase
VHTIIAALSGKCKEYHGNSEGTEMESGKRDSRIRIGLMHLAHETYWKYFPQHEKPTMDLARVFTKFIAGFGDVLETGKLVDSRARAREARLLFQEKDADVLVLATATYSTPDDVILELKRFVRPVVVWNTQKSAAIPRDLDFDKWMLEHGITGVPGITNLLEREGIPYFLISGHHTSETVREAFEIVFGAARAFGRIWGARIGMIGHLYPGMIDFGYDPTSMYTTFGAATVPVLEPVLSKAFDEVAERDVNALGDALSKRFAKAGDMTTEEYLQSVRTALAVKKVVEREALDAVTVYCQSLWQRHEMGVVPCLGMSLLMEEGVFCSCEGDVPTALSGMMLQSLSGSAFFTEIWCNDFENDQFMMGHSGTMNLGLFRSAPSEVKMVRHPWWTGCCGRGACLEVRMPPGRGTMMSLSQVGGSGWRMIVTTVEVVERDPVPLGAPNFFIKLDKPIARYLEDLASLGAAHHFSMAYGDWTAHLKALAKILKVEYSPV